MGYSVHSERIFGVNVVIANLLGAHGYNIIMIPYILTEPLTSIHIGVTRGEAWMF